MSRRRVCGRNGAIAAVMVGVIAGVGGGPIATAAGAEQAVPTTKSSTASVTQEEKIRAAAAVGITATPELLVLSERDFVFELWKASSTRPEVRASAELALSGTDAERSQWIKSGVHEAVKRDQDNQLRDAEAARLARELKQGAAAVIGLIPTPDKLVVSYRDFVYWLWQQVPEKYGKTRTAALAAFGATEEAQKEFLRTGIRTAYGEDQQDEINGNEQTSKEEKERLAWRAAKSRAMGQVLGVVPTEGMLALSDDNFIREILKRATPDTEVAAAANQALRDPDPAAWKRFIATGIFEADQRDKATAQAKQAEANRRRALEIQTRAQNSGLRPNLVFAAQAALAGADQDVENFLRVGQYQATKQSLRGETQGTRAWYIRGTWPGGGVQLSPGPEFKEDGTALIGEATWDVVTGLGRADCYSLEWVGHPGVYLALNGIWTGVLPNDGTEAYRSNATWCPRAGFAGNGTVSLESVGLPGRFLRQHNGGIVADPNDATLKATGNPRSFTADASWWIDGPNPPVVSPIVTRWLNDEAIRGRLGAAIDQEAADGSVRYRAYQHGRLYWTAATGVREIEGTILATYLRLGGHATIGVPTTDESGTPDGIGRYNHFAKDGSIYWTPFTGAHAVTGAIRALWAKMGWENSYLKYPISDETDIPGGRRVLFQGGRIDYDSTTGKATAYRK